MAADLSALDPDLRSKVNQLVERCRARGVEMQPYCALRDPFTQAKLWRQSRSRQEIEAKIAEFERKNAPFLAHCLRSVGPQNGDPVTNTAPGLSWHQWGEAIDCFWKIDGKAEWSTLKKVNSLNGYQVYAEEAEALGLTAGGHWSSFKDWPHVQLRKQSTPAIAMTLEQIDQAMKQRFGNLA